MGLDITSLGGWANSNSVYGIDVDAYSRVHGFTVQVILITVLSSELRLIYHQVRL